MAVLLVCAGVMLGGVFYTSCAYGGRDNPQNSTSTKAVVHVAGAAIDATRIEDTVRALLDRQMQQGPQGSAPTPDMSAQAYIQVLDELTESGAEYSLVKKVGAPTDDATLTKAANDSFEQRLEMARMQMMMQRQLKPGTSDADFEAMVKQQTGKGLAELRKDSAEGIKKSLADKDQRENLVRSLSKELLKQAASARKKVSDAELQESYSSRECKRILIRTGSSIKEKPEDRLAKAQADIAKGMSFEKAVDTYSTELPIGKKKLSENTTYVSMREIQDTPSLKPLLTLRPGQVSGIISTSEGPAIYKLITIKPNIPTDFAKNTAKYRKEYIDQAVSKEVDAQIEQAKSSAGFITFDSPALKALYDFDLARKAPFDATGTASQKRYQTVYDEAVAAAKSTNTFETKTASLARYMANNSLWNDPKADKIALRPARIETLSELLKNFESFDTRIELVNLYADAKNGPEASNQLLTAAQNNMSFNEVGTQRFGTIRDTLQRLQRDKLISTEQIKAISDVQLEWSRMRAEDEKQQAEQKKQQQAEAAQRAKEDAAERARAAAADRAAIGKAKTPAVPTPNKVKGPGPTDPTGGSGKK